MTEKKMHLEMGMKMVGVDPTVHKFPEDWDELRRRASSIWTIMENVNKGIYSWESHIKQAIVDDALTIIEIAKKEGFIL